MKKMLILICFFTLIFSQDAEIKSLLNKYAETYKSTNNDDYVALFLNDFQPLNYVVKPRDGSRYLTPKDIMPMMKSQGGNYEKKLTNIKISTHGKIAVAQYNWDLLKANKKHMSGYEITTLILKENKWFISDITYSITAMPGRRRRMH